MRSRPGLLIPLVVLSASLNAGAQGWDAPGTARGWSKADITGACAFYDGAGQKLQLWTQDDSLNGTVPLQKLERAPELWFFDARNNAWIASGPALYSVDKNGKILETVKLPLEVADLAWDAKSMYLVYRSTSLYVEKRDQRTGNLLWSQGAKPSVQTRTPSPLFRMVLSDDGARVLVVGGGDYDLTAFEASTGKLVDLIKMTPEAPLPPALQVTDRGRLPIHGWSGKPVLICAVSSGELGLEGPPLLHLLLATPSSRKVTLFKTALTADHQFIGVLENRAVFTKPSGGLVFIPLS